MRTAARLVAAIGLCLTLALTGCPGGSRNQTEPSPMDKLKSTDPSKQIEGARQAEQQFGSHK